MANDLYTNTVFVTGETPTHTKLNTFDANVEDGLGLLALAISQFGGNDRVIDNPANTTELEVTASVAPDMNVSVNTGVAIVSNTICQNVSATTLTIVSPTVSNRWTIIRISNEGVLSTKNSAEQAVPVEPSADADNIKLAAIYLPQNAPHIDDEGGAGGGDGEIFDRRTIFAYHPTTLERHVSFFIPGTLSTTGGSLSDGYYLGTSAGAGYTFGQAVTVNKGFIQCQDIPTGADLVFTIHNLVDPASDTITLSDGSATEEDTSISLAFDASDELAIECTQVGSTAAGGYAQIVLQYILQ